MTLPATCDNDVEACAYCGRRLDGSLYQSRPGRWRHALPTRDHVIPRALGGTNDPSNIVTACGECNENKGADTVEEFIARGLTSRTTARLARPCPTCTAPAGSRCIGLRGRRIYNLHPAR